MPLKLLYPIPAEFFQKIERFGAKKDRMGDSMTADDAMATETRDPDDED